MNKYETISNVVGTVVYILLTMIALMPIVLAKPYEADIYDLWNNLEEFEQSNSLRKFLIEKDWAFNTVAADELDYILVLTQQCSTDFFDDVPASLALAVISVESGFDKNLTGFSNDTGLMQVIPKFHHDRIKKYIYDENVDLYDPRLNVMVGMDYLQELLEWSNGDIQLAVMAYNMGQANALRYHNSGRVTSYSEKVMKRMYAIQDILERRS